MIIVVMHVMFMFVSASMLKSSDFAAILGIFVWGGSSGKDTA